MTKLGEGCMGKRGEGGMTKLGEGSMTKLGALSNDELLARLRAHVGRGNVWLIGLLAYLAEVDARRLYAEQACTSTWDFCVRKLGMSESEAQRRIAVARVVRRFPLAGGYLERGEVHLCALYELHKHVTVDNHEELLRAAVGKTTKAVAEMLAARFPKPDMHACVEPLDPQPALPVASAESAPPSDVAPSASATPSASAALPAPVACSTLGRPRVEPLSASRYRVELTVSAETKVMLENIQALMRHRNPSGDLEKIIEVALDLLLAKLEKERLGKTTRSKEKTPSTTTAADGRTSSAAQHSPKPARRRHVAKAAQREVWARDGAQCTYVDAHGNRCPGRAFLELDHIDAKALGGSDEAANLRLRCRVHNRVHAEHVFGRAYIEERIHFRQRKYAAPTQALPGQAAPAQAGPKPGAPTQARAGQAAPAQTGPKEAAPMQAGPKEAAPAQEQRKQSAPVQAGRKQATPVQAGRKQPTPAQEQRKQAASWQARSKSTALAHPPSFETAVRGLRPLGFRESEVREVITRLESSLEPDTSAETIVRHALRLLT